MGLRTNRATHQQYTVQLDAKNKAAKSKSSSVNTDLSNPAVLHLYQIAKGCLAARNNLPDYVEISVGNKDLNLSGIFGTSFIDQLRKSNDEADKILLLQQALFAMTEFGNVSIENDDTLDTLLLATYNLVVEADFKADSHIVKQNKRKDLVISLFTGLVLKLDGALDFKVSPPEFKKPLTKEYIKEISTRLKETLQHMFDPNGEDDDVLSNNDWEWNSACNKTLKQTLEAFKNPTLEVDPNKKDVPLRKSAFKVWDYGKQKVSHELPDSVYILFNRFDLPRQFLTDEPFTGDRPVHTMDLVRQLPSQEYQISSDEDNDEGSDKPVAKRNSSRRFEIPAPSVKRKQLRRRNGRSGTPSSADEGPRFGTLNTGASSSEDGGDTARVVYQPPAQPQDAPSGALPSIPQTITKQEVHEEEKEEDTAAADQQQVNPHRALEDFPEIPPEELGSNASAGEEEEAEATRSLLTPQQKADLENALAVTAYRKMTEELQLLEPARQERLELLNRLDSLLGTLEDLPESDRQLLEEKIKKIKAETPVKLQMSDEKASIKLGNTNLEASGLREEGTPIETLIIASVARSVNTPDPMSLPSLVRAHALSLKAKVKGLVASYSEENNTLRDALTAVTEDIQKAMQKSEKEKQHNAILTDLNRLIQFLKPLAKGQQARLENVEQLFRSLNTSLELDLSPEIQAMKKELTGLLQKIPLFEITDLTPESPSGIQYSGLSIGGIPLAQHIYNTQFRQDQAIAKNLPDRGFLAAYKTHKDAMNQGIANFANAVMTLNSEVSVVISGIDAKINELLQKKEQEKLELILEFNELTEQFRKQYKAISSDRKRLEQAFTRLKLEQSDRPGKRVVVDSSVDLKTYAKVNYPTYRVQSPIDSESSAHLDLESELAIASGSCEGSPSLEIPDATPIPFETYVYRNPDNENKHLEDGQLIELSILQRLTNTDNYNPDADTLMQHFNTHKNEFNDALNAALKEEQNINTCLEKCLETFRASLTEVDEASSGEAPQASDASTHSDPDEVTVSTPRQPLRRVNVKTNYRPQILASVITIKQTFNAYIDKLRQRLKSSFDSHVISDEARGEFLAIFEHIIVPTKIEELQGYINHSINEQSQTEATFWGKDSLVNPKNYQAYEALFTFFEQTLDKEVFGKLKISNTLTILKSTVAAYKAKDAEADDTLNEFINAMKNYLSNRPRHNLDEFMQSDFYSKVYKPLLDLNGIGSSKLTLKTLFYDGTDFAQSIHYNDQHILDLSREDFQSFINDLKAALDVFEVKLDEAELTNPFKELKQKGTKAARKEFLSKQIISLLNKLFKVIATDAFPPPAELLQLPPSSQQLIIDCFKQAETIFNVSIISLQKTLLRKAMFLDKVPGKKLTFFDFYNKFLVPFLEFKKRLRAQDREESDSKANNLLQQLELCHVLGDEENYSNADEYLYSLKHANSFEDFLVKLKENQPSNLKQRLQNFLHSMDVGLKIEGLDDEDSRDIITVRRTVLQQYDVRHLQKAFLHEITEPASKVKIDYNALQDLAVTEVSEEFSVDAHDSESKDGSVYSDFGGSTSTSAISLSRRSIFDLANRHARQYWNGVSLEGIPEDQDELSAYNIAKRNAFTHLLQIRAIEIESGDTSPALPDHLKDHLAQLNEIQRNIPSAIAEVAEINAKLHIQAQHAGGFFDADDIHFHSSKPQLKKEYNRQLKAKIAELKEQLQQLSPHPSQASHYMWTNSLYVYSSSTMLSEDDSERPESPVTKAMHEFGDLLMQLHGKLPERIDSKIFNSCLLKSLASYNPTPTEAQKVLKAIADIPTEDLETMFNKLAETAIVEESDSESSGDEKPTERLKTKESLLELHASATTTQEVIGSVIDTPILGEISDANKELSRQLALKLIQDNKDLIKALVTQDLSSDERDEGDEPEQIDFELLKIKDIIQNLVPREFKDKSDLLTEQTINSIIQQLQAVEGQDEKIKQVKQAYEDYKVAISRKSMISSIKQKQHNIKLEFERLIERIQTFIKENFQDYKFSPGTSTATHLDTLQIIAQNKSQKTTISGFYFKFIHLENQKSRCQLLLNQALKNPFSVQLKDKGITSTSSESDEDSGPLSELRQTASERIREQVHTDTADNYQTFIEDSTAPTMAPSLEYDKLTKQFLKELHSCGMKPEQELLAMQKDKQLEALINYCATTPISFKQADVLQGQQSATLIQSMALALQSQDPSLDPYRKTLRSIRNNSRFCSSILSLIHKLERFEPNDNLTDIIKVLKLIVISKSLPKIAKDHGVHESLVKQVTTEPLIVLAPFGVANSGIDTEELERITGNIDGKSTQMSSTLINNIYDLLLDSIELRKAKLIPNETEISASEKERQLSESRKKVTQSLHLLKRKLIPRERLSNRKREEHIQTLADGLSKRVPKLPPAVVHHEGGEAAPLLPRPAEETVAF